MMAVWGGNCVASPSNETKAGRDALERDPDTPGSLGIAISEAIEAAVSDKTGQTRYALGSVLNHVLLHQTIVGLETKKKMEKIGNILMSSLDAREGEAIFQGLPYLLYLTS